MVSVLVKRENLAELCKCLNSDVTTIHFPKKVYQLNIKQQNPMLNIQFLSNMTRGNTQGEYPLIRKKKVKKNEREKL